MYNNSKALSSGFKVGSAEPIDDRLVYASTQQLLDLITNDPAAPLRFYEGMVITITGNESQYVWKASNEGLLTTSFVYPAPYVVNGVDYSTKAFNFKPIFVVVDQPYYAENLEVIANTPFSVAHGLNTNKVIVYAWEGDAPVFLDYEIVDSNEITLLSSENITVDIKVTK